MQIKNQKILLTVVDRGQVAAPVANACSKSLKSKILKSPFESSILDKRGVPTGKYKTPKNHFLASNDFVSRGTLECTRKTTLQESVVNYFVSSDSYPNFIPKKRWDKMSDIERLEVHLRLNAEGKEFTYELL